MFDQPQDFQAESDALYALLSSASDADFDQPTQFKGWTIGHVIGHLHMWNHAADLSLAGGDGFKAFMADVFVEFQNSNLRTFEERWLDGLAGRALLEEWQGLYTGVAERFSQADPKARVAWAGPDMSVRSSITARLMETWAHGQEIYDHMGVTRVDHDRIKNIAVLGINTFGWTFKNRKRDVPEVMPQVRLTAPSGAVWVWNDEVTSDVIAGSATEFCQVVTQTRNIADTGLAVTGDVAAEWMAIAQCFAGAPEDPPAPGTRFRVR
ncbi:MAG: TIGR03084 family protein [Rhodobacteraceae bacterium]|nr:TIGR03084 family protein [Paracoccaceae bacterium]